ncbi:hypothetical protein [Algoriphagus namhaensis]
MKNKIILLSALIWIGFYGSTVAQRAGDYFNKAARSYVKTERDQALATVNEGLSKFPNDPKLEALKEKLEKEKEEQEQNQQDKQNQDQQQDQQQQQDSSGEQGDQKQQNQDGEQTQEDKADESQEGNPENQSEDPSENANDQMDANLADRNKAMEEFKEKLKAMNLTPEQAAQILENMNAAELRYIQQNKKRPTERPKKGIPDW